MTGFFKFLIAVFISFLPGLFGIVFSPVMKHDNWYALLQHSVFTPEPWVFSIAWCFLYLLLGIALFIIFNTNISGHKKETAYVVFALHMLLNAMWSYLFFGLHSISISFLEILVLLGISIWMFVEFLKINKVAGYIIIPYVIWLCFASYLNMVIVVLN